MRSSKPSSRATERCRHRVWSMAASRAGDRIAFSCADKLQEKRYGITIGDAIQNTWMYDDREVVGVSAPPLTDSASREDPPTLRVVSRLG